MQAALEKEATVRLARFERVESWNGLMPGDSVRITGHRGGTWKFRAFVTNTSNGASWVEVSEVLASGRRGRKAPAADAAEESDGGGTSMTRTRSFRPELVIPVRKPGRRRPRRPAPPAAPIAPDQPAVQTSLFGEEVGGETP
jgi:hypothetical protein